MKKPKYAFQTITVNILCWHIVIIRELIFQTHIRTGYKTIYFPNLQLTIVEGTLQSKGEVSSRHIKMSNDHTFIDDERKKKTKTKWTVIICV